MISSPTYVSTHGAQSTRRVPSMWVAKDVSLSGGVEGLGKVFSVTFSTPFGDKRVSANVPYEEMAKSTLDELVTMIEAELPRLMAPLLAQAGAYVTDVLWPSMQPKLRLELERLLRIAKAEAQREVDRVLLAASAISGVLLLGMVGSAIMIKRGSRSKR